jgi:hypothetical protein
MADEIRRMAGDSRLEPVEREKTLLAWGFLVLPNRIE